MSTQSRERSRSEKAAAISKANARRERNRVLLVVGVVVVVIAVVAAGILWATRGSSSTEAAASPANLKSAVSGTSLVVGNDPDAKVKVVIYEDFLCPYCRQFETQSRDYLRTDAAQGKVLVTYRPFHLLQDDYSTLALNAWSQVLDKGTPKQALAFHDALYENQPYEQDTNKPGVSDLAALAKKSGIAASVTSSFGTENTTFLTTVANEAKQAGVQSTPTIIVNGTPLKGDTIDDLSSNLEKMIAAG